MRRERTRATGASALPSTSPAADSTGRKRVGDNASNRTIRRANLTIPPRPDRAEPQRHEVLFDGLPEPINPASSTLRSGTCKVLE